MLAPTIVPTSVVELCRMAESIPSGMPITVASDQRRQAQLDRGRQPLHQDLR